MEQEDKAVNEWLRGQKPTTRYTYNTIFHHFMEYVKMNGDQILASRKEDKDRLWEKKVEEFNIEMRKTKSSNYVKSMMGAIRSFFEFHYVPLMFRTNTARKLVEASRTTRDYLFTKDELYKMYESGDLTDRYIIAVGKSVGLRAIDFIAFERGTFEAYLDRETPISIGEINTIKENVRAYPFLDADATKIIKLMLDKMNAEGRKAPNERILTFEKKMLSIRLQHLAKKIGINSNGRIIRFHNLRKFLFDRLTSVTSDTKAKMIVGKAISEGAYVSPELLREDYKRVIPMISFNINGVNGTKIEELGNEIADLKKNFNSLKLGVIRVIDTLQSTNYGLDPAEIDYVMEQLCGQLGVDIREIRSTRQLRKAVTGKEEE